MEMTPALASICDSLNIEVVPTNERRGPRTTHAVDTLERILNRHGAGHLTFALRTIVETGHNANALAEPVVWAVSDVVLAQPAWASTGLSWLEAFDRIDLLELWGYAKLGGTPGPRQTIAALIIDRLRPIFSERKENANVLDA
jgi:hypothetical protein